MKEEVKQAIFNYFRRLGRIGGNTVQPGDILVLSVKANLPYQLKGWYDEVVQDLCDVGFFTFKELVPSSGNSLGSLGGYAITSAGIARL